ncbi:MAG: Rieske 2Fe-2S domain-containing protein [Gammaproteobacteria bacterium]|nr:Rieske 2Fe-2S domain-containing protein [Gammaproteobacteria bacterium]
MAQSGKGINLAIQTERKRLLIDATISAISKHGLSNLTLAKIAGPVGMTAGMVNFHFDSKESLLLETLKSVAEEFELAIKDAVNSAIDEPGAKLQALIDTNLNANISETRKVAVWYAFLSETRTRKEYQRICGERDRAYYKTINDLCEQIVLAGQKQDSVDADILADGLAGMLDGFWSDILFEGDGFERDNAVQRTYSYLVNVFPWRFSNAVRKEKITTLIGDDEDELIYTLPAWIYDSPEFFEQERQKIFMPSWQLVCHISDLPKVGSYVRYDMFNERAFVVRGNDNKIAAYQNVCSHRAHTLVQDHQGECAGRLVCPYHGWSYGLDGQRIGVGAPESFRPHDKSKFGLKALDVEVFLGFVYIRYLSEGPSVAECFEPVAEEFKVYQTEDMQPLRSEVYGGQQFWTEVVDIDWKNGLENYVEDYHFPGGHKGLSALMNPEYDREPLPNGVCRLSHRMRETPLRNWSAEHYQRVLPKYAHLPEYMQDRWTYYTLFPNTFFDMFPEQMDFMQMIPLAPGKMLLRGSNYALPGTERNERAARYLSDRINGRVQKEDNFLTSEVQKGLATSGYQRGILSDKEVLVKHFQDWVREKLPAAKQNEPL